MDASAPTLARLRGLELSAHALRVLTTLNAAMLVLIVATGATVRLTGSGLGCEHWPGCQPHHFEPKSFHSYIEFSNRVFAFFTILVTLLTWLYARGHRRLAFLVFFGTLLQAPLGALTVHFGLDPWLVGVIGEPRPVVNVTVAPSFVVVSSVPAVGLSPRPSSRSGCSVDAYGLGKPFPWPM